MGWVKRTLDKFRGNKKETVEPIEATEAADFSTNEMPLVPWYKTEKHYDMVIKNGYVKMELLPAGWVYVLEEWIKGREKMLDYCKHTKRRAQLEKKIKRAKEILDICIDKRVDVKEAFKIARGQK